MNLVLATLIGAVIGYVVGVLIEKKHRPRQSTLRRSRAGVRQQLLKKSNHVRRRSWSNK